MEPLHHYILMTIGLGSKNFTIIYTNGKIYKDIFPQKI